MRYNKYTTQKLQVSHDDGETWEDVSPLTTRLGVYQGTYFSQEDCLTGSPTLAYANVEITQEMKDTLYTYILEDGTILSRHRNDVGAENEISITDEGVRLEEMTIDWWPDYDGRQYNELCNKVRTIIIGNEIDVVRGYVKYLIEQFKYCNYLYLCDSIKVFTLNVQQICPNIDRIRMSRRMREFNPTMPYLKELTFDGNVSISFPRMHFSYLKNYLKIITVNGALKNFHRGGTLYNDTPNLETILVYGGLPEEIIHLNDVTRLYVPNGILDRYRPMCDGAVIPMSMYHYDVANISPSGKATALNIYGSTVTVPSNGNSILTEEETYRYFSASTMGYNYVDGRIELAFIKVNEDVTRIDDKAFSMDRQIMPLRGYTSVVTLSLPSTLTSMGKMVFDTSSIQNLIFNGLTPPTLDNTFTNESAHYDIIKNIYVPDSAYHLYFQSFAENCPWEVGKLKPLSEYNKF